jgi:hypothetical protein
LCEAGKSRRPCVLHLLSEAGVRSTSVFVDSSRRGIRRLKKGGKELVE